MPGQDLEHLEHLDQLLRYVVDRWRKHSQIVEPDQRINPHRHHAYRLSRFERALAELPDLVDGQELTSRVEKLLAGLPKGAKGEEDQTRVLQAGLEEAAIGPVVNTMRG